MQKIRQEIPVLDLDLLEKSTANLRATPRGRRIKKEIYYTLKRARSQMNREDSEELLDQEEKPSELGDNKSTKSCYFIMTSERSAYISEKKSNKSRIGSDRTEGHTINQKLDKLSRANYRNTLKRQAFTKLQAYYRSKDKNKRATEYYISKLLSRMVRNWRYTIEKMLEYQHEVTLMEKKAYL